MGMSIVGKVALKVWPDLRNFRKELKAEAKKESAGVDVELPVHVDSSRLREELRRAAREASAGMRGVKLPRVRVQPEVDQSAWDAFKQGIDRFDSRIRMAPRVNKKDLDFAKAAMENAFAEHGIRVSVDRPSLTSVRDQIRQNMKDLFVRLQVRADEARARAEEARLKKLLGDFKLNIKPDLKANRVNLVKQQLRVLFGEVGIRVKAMLNPRSVASSVAVLQAAFRDIRVKVKPVIDSKAFAITMTTLNRITGARLMGKKIMAFDFLKDLDLALPRIGLLSVGIGSLINLIIAGTGSLLAFGRGLAEIVPGGLALPGVFAGMATSATSFGLALSEIKARFPVVMKGLSAIKEANNNAFWLEATKAFRSLTGAWIPRFISGMRTVGQASGFVFASILKNLNKLVTPQLAGWFAATAAGLRSFDKVGGSKGIALMVRGFGDLGAIYFPRFSMWLGKITNQFGTWLTQAVASGNAMDWIDQATYQLGNLARLLGGIGSIFASLSNAATAGGVGLARMADDIEVAAGILASPAVQFGLIGVFDAAYRAMGNLFTVAGPGLNAFFSSLTTAIPTLLPIIGAVGGQLVGMFASILGNEAVWNGITDMFLGIGAAITTLQPAIAPLSQGLAGLAVLIGTTFRSIAPLMTAALAGVGDAANGLLAALNQVVPILMGGFYQAFVAIEPLIATLTPLLSALVVQVGTALGNALAGLAPSLGGLADGLGVLFGALVPVVGTLVTTLINGLAPVLAVVFTALGQIAVVLSPLVALIGGVLNTVLQIALGAIQKAAAVVLPMIVDAMGRLVEALTPVITALQTFLTENGPAIEGFLAFLITTIGMAIPGIINGVAAVITGVTQAILGIFNLFKDLFTGNWDNLGNDLMQIVGGLFEAIKGIIEVALNVGVLSIAGKGLSLLKGLFTDSGTILRTLWDDAWNTIKNIAVAIWDDIKSIVSGGLGSIKGFLSTAVDLMKLGWEGFWTGVKIAAEDALKALGSAIKGHLDTQITSFSTLPQRILSALGDLGSLLVNSGKSLLEGLAKGIRQGVDGAIGAATNALDAIRRLFPFSPAKEGPFSGKGWTLYSGMSISDALADGIAARASSPKRAALAVVGDIQSALSDASLGSTIAVTRAMGGGADSASGGGDNYDIHVSVDAKDLAEVTDIVEWAKALRRRTRALGGGA